MAMKALGTSMHSTNGPDIDDGWAEMAARAEEQPERISAFGGISLNGSGQIEETVLPGHIGLVGLFSPGEYDAVVAGEFKRYPEGNRYFASSTFSPATTLTDWIRNHPGAVLEWKPARKGGFAGTRLVPAEEDR
jgi:hypothetical protein